MWRLHGNLTSSRLYRTIGTKVLLTSGNQAEIVAIKTQAESGCVRYLDALDEPELVGTEAWLSADEVIAIDMGMHAEGRP
jgi:hypothetical protein